MGDPWLGAAGVNRLPVQMQRVGAGRMSFCDWRGADLVSVGCRTGGDADGLSVLEGQQPDAPAAGDRLE